LEDLIRRPAAEQAAQPAAQRLVAEALKNSGRDNTTAVVIEFPSTPNPALQS